MAQSQGEVIMPCGGIVPIEVFPGAEWAGAMVCWHCEKKVPMGAYFCYEWDCLLHEACIPDFLKSDEGQIIVLHGHTIEFRGLGIE